jgi:hypothetical protein
MNFTQVASTTPRTGYIKAGLGKAALKLALVAAAAMGVLGAGQAQALVVSVHGHDWDVTTFTGSYNDNTSKFATAANGGVMPWWGNKELAGKFSQALFDKLGAGQFGPQFGWRFRQTPPHNSDPRVDYAFTATDGTLSLNNSFSAKFEHTWAQATKVPGPLPALGLAAAFGYSRKLRKRIKSSEPEVISTTAL